MSDQIAKPRTTVSAVDYVSMIQKISKQFPHVAIRSKSPKTPCYFYNVYLKESIQEELNTYQVAATDTWSMLEIFGDCDLNFAVKQKNAKGFFQVTVSYANGEGSWEKRETHMLTGEAGSRERAIVKAVTLHLLVWDNAVGIWRFSDKLLKDKDDF